MTTLPAASGSPSLAPECLFSVLKRERRRRKSFYRRVKARTASSPPLSLPILSSNFAGNVSISAETHVDTRLLDVLWQQFLPPVVEIRRRGREEVSRKRADLVAADFSQQARLSAFKTSLLRTVWTGHDSID